MNDTATRPFERLTLRNVRCFRDVTIELDPQVTVLLGENGSGKTTVVEALASLAAGEGEGLAEFPLARGAKSGEIALYDEAASKPVAGWVSGKQVSRLPKEHPLFAYGRYRRVFFPGEEGPEPQSPDRELQRLAERATQRQTATVFEPDNYLLRDLSRYLVALHFGSTIDPVLATIWKRLNRSLSKLGHGIEGIEMERSTLGYIPKVIRRGRSWKLRELSDGYQAILVIVFDLVLRFSFLHPTLDNPLERKAVVVIDEVDLHLHPRWQRVVLRQLVELFPNTQFIVTTHSPSIVQGGIDDERAVVTLQENGDRVVVSSLTDEERRALQGAEIGSVLAESRLFDTGSRFSPEYSEVEVRIEKIQRRMEKGTATEKDRRQLFADLDTYQKLVAADEERREDGSFLSQIVGLRIAFFKDLEREIQKAKG